MPENTVTIESKEFNAQMNGWLVRATSVIGDATRSGQEFVALDENATDEQIKDAIIDLYT